MNASTNEMGENLTGSIRAREKSDEAKSYYTSLYADIHSIITQKKTYIMYTCIYVYGRTNVHFKKEEITKR